MQYGICSGRTAWGRFGYRGRHVRTSQVKWLQLTNLGPTTDGTDNGTKCPPVLQNYT